VMVKELARLAGVAIAVPEAGAIEDPEGAKRIEALTAIHGHGDGPRRITFRFGLTPTALAVEGGRLTAARFVGRDGAETVLPCDAFLTAIGFEAQAGLPRDALIAAADDVAAGRLAPGLYATGWFRRGPRGTIPESRADAQALAAVILADLAQGGTAGAKPGRAALAGRPGLVDYAGWKRIDTAETSGVPADRVRRKIGSRAEMLTLALQKEPNA